MTSFWSRFSLRAQIAILSTALLAIVISITAAVNISNLQAGLKEDLLKRSLALGQSLSAPLSYDLVQEEFDAIEISLLNSAEFPEVESLKLIDTNGVVLGNVIKTNQKKIHVSFAQSRDAGPQQLKNAQEPISIFSQNSLDIWYPLKTSSVVGWLNITISYTQLELLHNEIIRKNVIAAIFIIFINIVFLLIVLTKPTRRIRDAIDVAQKLDTVNPPQTNETGGSRELNHLFSALNDAAARLTAQHQEIETQTNELQRSRAEAEAANRAKSEFLSTMSHELRTPLNAILGFGQLLDMEFNETSDIGAQEHIRDIMQAGYHLLDLINEVLDLSRIEAGHLDISHEPIALHQAITESVTQIDVGLARARDVTLINQVSDKDIVILADPMRFKQVIINLLSNAVKYNKEGGTVTIKAEPLDNERLRIAIIDTGNGIATTDIDKLFDPFERLSYKNSNVVGTGIGLTVTKQLVEAMDGAIGVESIVGQGSTFMADFPLYTGMSRSVISNKPPLTKTGVTTENKKHTILYIEDNPVNARLVLHALNHRRGFNVLTSPTAELGLTLAEENIPDIILMDINLPGIDGIAALKILRSVETTSNIPVIAVTADAADDDIQAGRDAGFDGYLTKPINLDQLYSIIENRLLTQIQNEPLFCSP